MHAFQVSVGVGVPVVMQSQAETTSEVRPFTDINDPEMQHPYICIHGVVSVDLDSLNEVGRSAMTLCIVQI